MQQIGKYNVIKELGRGATSAVYLAQDPFNARQVAIKLMFFNQATNAEDIEVYRAMFLAEAGMAGKIIHPHIVSIYDAVVEKDQSYLVMEYVEGGTLEKFCQPDSLLPPDTVAEIAFKCVRALAFASIEGVIHRDLKPGNVLYKSGSDIKVADFGASVSTKADRSNEELVGSPMYLAPELLGGMDASEQSDIYAMGMVMYMLLAGRPPFEARSQESLSYQILNVEPEPPSSFRQGVSSSLEDIVRRAIAKDPAKRYRNWEAFGLDLSEYSRVASKMAAVSAVKRTEVSDTERFNLAKSLSFFRSFPESELWEVLRISKWRAFPPESALIKENESGDSFFLLAQGTVRVTRSGKLLNVLGQGDCFGEMSYLASKTSLRSATVTTATDCIIIKIPAKDLSTASPTCRQRFDRRFLDTLIERLEAANQQLVATT
jgi:serine/threonine protein kinase